jgi:hypothetical protein
MVSISAASAFELGFLWFPAHLFSPYLSDLSGEKLLNQKLDRKP